MLVESSQKTYSDLCGVHEDNKDVWQEEWLR